MVRYFLGACALAAAGSAGAQTTATLFGIVDAGLVSLSTGSGRTTRVDPGIMAGSRWGVRGTEDLGGGLSAMFWLEGHVNNDTGTGTATGGGLDFQRRSFVGLQGPFGQFSLGRDYTPGFWAGLANDATGYGLMGTTLSFIAAGGLTSRTSNGLFYNSPVWSGLRIRAMYAMGEQPSPSSSVGDMRGLAALYADSGIHGNAYYQDLKVSAAGRRTVQYGFGAGYRTAGWRAVAGRGVANPDGAANSTSHWNLGAAVSLGPGELSGQVIRLKADVAGARGTTLATSYRYPLSKRSTLYASYGRTRNSAAARFALSNGGSTYLPATPGATVSGLAVGLRHDF